jgi:toxin-antitoxin system PIN domain toxin
VTLLDANVLVYAYDPGAAQHAVIRDWLDQLLDSSVVLVPWVSVWALLRVATNPRLKPNQPPVREVFRAIRNLLDHPNVRIVEPGPRHAEILERLAVGARAMGPRLTDAVLAAIAIEHGAQLASTDKEFVRFDGLKWIDPLAVR